MARAWAIAATAALLACGGPPLLAQEIFWDGFEYGDLCLWSSLPATIFEQEAFDESGTNDENAELVPGRCFEFVGTIGEPYDVDPGPGDLFQFDTDYFELALEGPALIEIRLERFGDGSLFEPYVEMENDSDVVLYGYFPLALPEADPVVTSRFFYLPENDFQFEDPPQLESKDLPASNAWRLWIADDRNYVDAECPCGGETNRYRLTLRHHPLVGPTVSVPYSQTAVTMPADGSLLIRRIPAGVATLDEVETFHDRHVPPFEEVLDTRLFLVRREASRLETIAGDDDFAYDAGSDTLLHVDSRLDSQSLGTGQYYVVVDYYDKLSQVAIDFELTIQFLQRLWH